MGWELPEWDKQTEGKQTQEEQFFEKRKIFSELNWRSERRPSSERAAVWLPLKTHKPLNDVQSSDHKQAHENKRNGDVQRIKS